MKITFVFHNFLPIIGGTEIPMYYYAKELIERGYQVEICTNYPIEFKNKGLKEEEIINGILVKRYKYVPLPFDKYIFFSPSVLPDLFSTNTDVFHIFLFPSFISIVTCLIAKIRRIPIVIYPQCYPNRHRFYHSALKRIASFFVDKAIIMGLVKMSNYVVALTNKEAEFYKKKGITNIEVIREPISLQSSPQFEISIIRKKYGLKDYKTLLFVGRVSEHKGVDILIKSLPEVLNYFPKTKLLIVGENLGRLSKYAELAHRLKCNKNVIFTGTVTDLELSCIYKLADIVIMPSIFEGYGRVIVEAWSFKKPVITTKTVGLAELVSKENGILVDYGDSDALSKAIIELLSEGDVAKAMGVAGYRLVKEEITWEKAVDKLEKIYHSVKYL